MDDFARIISELYSQREEIEDAILSLERDMAATSKQRRKANALVKHDRSDVSGSGRRESRCCADRTVAVIPLNVPSK